MGDVNDDDFNPLGGTPPPQMPPPPAPDLASSIDRVAQVMRRYVDAQDAETREVFESRMREWEQAVTSDLQEIVVQLEWLGGRLAVVEARDGGEAYRQWVVSELKRVGKKKDE